jgi:hypothetical protein
MIPVLLKENREDAKSAKIDAKRCAEKKINVFICVHLIFV